MRYKGYNIEKDPMCVRWPSYTYVFVHEDYDGAEDSGDPRYGHGPTVEECKQLIDEIEEPTNVLCGCGWGMLGIPEYEIPRTCPTCGFSLRITGEASE